MTKSRASIFGANNEEPPPLDVGSFAPKVAVDVKAPAVEQVRAVSQSANFKSREPGAAKTEGSAKTDAPAKPEVPAKRAIRRYRTGRNVQFNIKADKETVDAFYAITEAQKGWVLGYTLQRAIEALKRELKHST
jgi:hypothetical protein